ncbi:chromate efflux transporter [Maricaulis maris]|uniref:chromate efflux transporter n=1 Tax=Maricaulis maris TaxID=74318 RepID=UPI00291CA50B|nr:chromate transporter [Maricaulis maris]
MDDPSPSHQRRAPVTAIAEVFLAFLKLGLTAFGGPIAHIGFFRDEFVVRRRWMDDAAFADLVALCQFLPGPASSQVGLALGLMRAGWLGGLAAFVGFTLPSAVILFIVALTGSRLSGDLSSGIVAGLKLVAVAIIAHAVLGMARTLCPDRLRASIAVLAVIILAVLPAVYGMPLAILAGASLGLWRGEGPVATGAAIAVPVSRTAGVISLGLAATVFIALPIFASHSPVVALADSFYRSGMLVFGGGHVVLPLLQVEVVEAGQVSLDAFLAGYGAAQAVPGPLFTFGAYLGAIMESGPSGLAGALIAMLSLFAPGFLLLVGTLPFWAGFRRHARARAIMAGANAAVVGILGAALYDPVFTSAVTGFPEFTLALSCFVLLVSWKCPPWLVVLLGAAGGGLLAIL